MPFETLNQLEQELSKLKSVTDEIGKTKDASSNALTVSENIIKQYEKLAFETNDLVSTIEHINFPERFESLSKNLLDTHILMKDSTAKVTKYANETYEKYSLISEQIKDTATATTEKIDLITKSVIVLHNDLEAVNHRIDKTETSLLTLNQATQNLHTKVDDLGKEIKNSLHGVIERQEEGRKQLSFIKFVVIINFVFLGAIIAFLFLMK